MKKYVFGTPIPTGAVTAEVEQGRAEDIPYFSVSEGNVLNFKMDEDTAVYGLGPNVRGINKRGWVYEAFNTDEVLHVEDRRRLYGSHTYLLIDGKVKFGIFIDTAGFARFDIGYTKSDDLTVTVRDGSFTAYIFEADTLVGLVKELRRLTGSSYAPPLWAFGFNQSRWGYKNEGDIRSVLENYRRLDMPIDMITMDIDYMDRYKDFTVDEERFPDFPAFVSEMNGEHVHLVPIIDAGIKAEEGDPVFDECMKKGYYCKKADGTPFYLAVWPGKCVFPDFMNDDAARWFGDQYKALTDIGIRGFWNDMNEPSIFYSFDRLKFVMDKIGDYKDKDLDVSAFGEMQALVSKISQREDYTKDFCHTVDGELISNEKLHNIFGFKMSKAAAEGLKRLVPEERTLIFSRSSFVGLHRYAGIWYGDNRSWWEHLKLNVRQAAEANMSGFLYSGADVGGFGSDATEDLAMRWLAFGIFSPLFRNHSATGTRDQEFYRFERPDDFRALIRLRYALLPFIYSEFMKAVCNDGMYFKPLSFVYEDDRRAKEVEDELIVGDSILIAPVCEQNKSGRYVYLPEKMRLYRMRSQTDYDTEVMEKGDHYIECALNEVLVFVRPGCVLPLADARNVRSSYDVDFDDLTPLKFDENERVEYIRYFDGGLTNELSFEKFTKKIEF